MKTFLSVVFSMMALSCIGQKYQTTQLEGMVVPDSLHVAEVSSDSAITRICLTAMGGKKSNTYLLISDRQTSNKWSAPYVALTLRGNSMHGRLSADGNRIFFIKDIDNFRGEGSKPVPAGVSTDLFTGVYVSDLLSEKTWSPPNLLDDYFSLGPVVNSLSLSPNERNLIFTYVDVAKRGKPAISMYSVQKNAQNKWVEASSRIVVKDVVMATVVGNKTISGDIFHLNNNTIVLNAADGSYLAPFDGKTLGKPTKIEYFGGPLQWIDPSAATAITFTRQPFKISLVHLRPPKAHPSLPIELATNEPRAGDITPAEDARVIKPTGKYMAVLIGVSSYDKDNLNLERPVKDAEELKTMLTTHYTFDAENVLSLVNPTRQEIINLLFKLRTTIGPNDNLLIFYAGHGYYDRAIHQGYWWPKDASPENPSNWLSNSDLREQIRGIKSAHTLLITDACFSGGIFRTRGVDELRAAPREIILLYRTPSRRAITSGNLSSVPDRSVFFSYLVKRLTENSEKYLPSQQLFAQMKPAVMNNSNTVPQDGVITDAGDEGGDFIFIKK